MGSTSSPLVWQVLDLRARVQGGCYFVSLARDETRGEAYIARFCADPREQPVLVSALTGLMGPTIGSIDYSYTRYRGIGHSEMLNDVKQMCEADAVQYQKCI